MATAGKIIKTAGFTFTWHIEDFSIWIKHGSVVIDSPVFCIEQLHGTEWKLMLCTPADDEENITLNLYRCEKDQNAPAKIDVDGKLFIAKNDGTCIFLHKFCYYFHVAYSYDNPLAISQSTILENPSMFLRKDTLTVGFQFFMNPDTPIDCSGRTKLCLMEYTIYLPITYPEISNDAPPTIISPIVSTCPEHPKLRIYTICHDLNSEHPVIIQIQMTNLNYNGFAKCNFSFSSSDAIQFETETFTRFTPSRDYAVFGINITKATFRKNSMFKANCLKCELVVSNGVYSSRLERTIYMQNECDSSNNHDLSHLQGNLMEMHSENSLCDFKIIASGKEFSIHKAIFAAASPVFKAMFESSMVESEASKVTIEEYEAETVEKMFEFIYSGRVKDLTWDSALELYSIADKYQIKNLKSTCTCFLKSVLNIESVPKLLTFANFYGDCNLSKTVENFICDNSNAVFQSETWKNFMKNDAQVACETMQRICQSVL